MAMEKKGIVESEQEGTWSDQFKKASAEKKADEQSRNCKQASANTQDRVADAVKNASAKK